MIVFNILIDKASVLCGLDFRDSIHRSSRSRLGVVVGPSEIAGRDSKGGRKRSISCSVLVAVPPPVPPPPTRINMTDTLIIHTVIDTVTRATIIPGILCSLWLAGL